MTLYELREAFQQLMLMLEQAENEEEIQVVMDTIESMKGDIEEKAEGIIEIMKECEADAEKCDKEAKAFAKRAKMDQNKADRLKKYLLFSMESIGVTKMQAGIFKLSIQHSGGIKPVIYDGDPADLDDRFQKVTIELNKEEARKALDAGEEDLPFRYGERGNFLKIR